MRDPSLRVHQAWASVATRPAARLEGAVSTAAGLPQEGAGGATASPSLLRRAASVLERISRRILGRAVAAAAPPLSVPLEAIGDLVTWHDGFGDVVHASAASWSILGTQPATLAGDGLLSRVHVSDRPLFLTALSDAANGAGPVCVEFRVHRDASGEDGGGAGRGVGWLEMRAHRLPGHDGASVVAFSRDITLQKAHACELDTARLEAERASELKGRFLATVSHELRTPLNAIIGFSELLSADHPFRLTEERRREYGAIIRNSGTHLLEIVNTLLDMSKIESGNFDVECEPFDMGELASACCDLLQIKADEAGIRLERHFAQELPEITADRRACRQILINLISNAVKFTPPGGEVTVTLTRQGSSIVLAVSDTGIGIAEADLPRLGDPFFQSGDVHRRNHEGTGLGLSVVRGLVGLHRGEITIESGSGAGTAVTVKLPLTAGASGRVSAKPVTLHTRARVPARPRVRRSA